MTGNLTQKFRSMIFFHIYFFRYHVSSCLNESFGFLLAPNHQAKTALIVVLHVEELKVREGGSNVSLSCFEMAFHNIQHDFIRAIVIDQLLDFASYQ